MSLTVIVPSRQRPHQAFLTYESFKNTVDSTETYIVFAVDWNDPEMDTYRQFIPWEHLWQCGPEDSGSFQRVLNGVAPHFPSAILGSVGDDHRFRTRGWDTRVKEALQQPGIAYANDLYQRDILPTAAFMSREVYEALGWFALPVCDHLYIDNAWKDIGLGIDSLHYLPDVIIEHLHYTNHKSAFDASYARTNARSQFDKDALAYSEWIGRGRPWEVSQRQKDIERVKDALKW